MFSMLNGSWTCAVQTRTPAGTKDLRRYMQLTALPAMIAGPGAPPMPPRGHTTHRNNLSVRAEDWRRLESMLALSRRWVDNEVIKFVDKYVSSFDLCVSATDEVTGDRITVPCPEYFSVPELILGRPSNLSQVCRWVIDYPLTTLQRVLHLSLPQTKAWSFSSISPDVDEDLVACVTWDRITEEKTVQSAVAVIIQPPWIASLTDLERFVACSTLRRVDRNYDPDSPENTYKNKERMWAKAWDICARRKCQWFVVTTYWGWVCGAFSKGMTKGFVVPVRHFHDKKPTVLELLMWWFASAMEIEGSWSLPPVPEHVADVNLGDDDEIPDEPYGRFPSPPASESSWSAASSARVESIVGDDDEEQEVMSLLMPTITELIAPAPIEDTRMKVQENIANWQTKITLNPSTATSYHIHSIQMSPFATQSVYSSTTASSFASTVKEFGGRAKPGCGWLASEPIAEE